MKKEIKNINTTITTYISDDGVIRSEFESDVKRYEDNLKAINSLGPKVKTQAQGKTK